MSIGQTARAFFDGCETGGGWDACKAHCHHGASYACQGDALAETTTLDGYAE
jgi:hypothetical protein